MKNILYISCEGNGEKKTGVGKKIYFQIKALKNLGFNVNYIYLKDKAIMNNETKIGEVGIKVLRRVLFFKELNKIILPKTLYIYIRHPGTTPLFLYFLKKNYKDKKIILEIPTYPYDKEAKTGLLKIYGLIDKVTRRYLKKYITNIVTYSDDKKIWNIPCINISNGIDLEEIHLVNKKERNKDKVVLTSVSSCCYWHGIDRMLYSLDEYGKDKNKKEIIFNIVGEGGEINKLKEIVIKSKYLLKVVKFTGIKSGKELEEIYNQTDIAIGSLGRHRSGLDTMRALKNREYCAVGLPMIFSEDDPDFRKVPFVYHISKNEKLIDIQELLKWYENLKIAPEEIRKYAEEFTWDKQIKKVIDEIEKI